MVLTRQESGERFVSVVHEVIFSLTDSELLHGRFNPCVETFKVSSFVISQGSICVMVPLSTDLLREVADEAILLLVLQDHRSSG